MRNTNNVWDFNGTNNVFDKYTRVIKIEDVQRLNGDIVSSGGIVDVNTKKITSSVTWNYTAARPQKIDTVTYLTNWRTTTSRSGQGGLLVYGNGGTTSDNVQYKFLDGATGAWGPANTLDFDPGAADKALRAVKVYSSPTRNENIVISRHIAGSNNQSIWVHVWDGTKWTSTMLSSWTSQFDTDVRNFDGDYLSDGRFVAVYSDNSSIPKYRIWDGCNWTAGQLSDIGNVPLYIVARSRPGTNEMMTVFYTSVKDTYTQYFKSNTWSLHARHSQSGQDATEMIDFAWSPQNPVKGALIYPEAQSGSKSRYINLKIFTADNSQSGGVWSSTIKSPTNGNNTIGALNLDGRKGSEEFIGCRKDTANAILCYRATTAPNWSSPNSNNLGIADNSLQKSFDFSYESLTGTNGLAVFSNNTNTPQRSIYTPPGNGNGSFGTPGNLLTTQLGGTLITVSTRAYYNNDDIMVLMGDSQSDLYSVVWNGSTNTVYTTPSGKARSQHGTNGSAPTEYWYDFAWDRY